MTIVYVDSYLLLNTIVNYLILMASGKLAGETLSRLRAFVAACGGAVYGLCAFFPQTDFLMHPLIRLCAGALMLLLAYGPSPRFLRLCILFFVITAAFSGLLLATQFLKGGEFMADGTVYSALDVRGILIAALAVYALLSLFFRRSATHIVAEEALIPLRLHRGGRVVLLQALRDSGNTLQDPVTGQPILVAEGARLAPLFPSSLNPKALSTPMETLSLLAASGDALGFRLLPYRAVGVSCGLLLAMRVDRVELSDCTLRQQWVALSPTPVSDGGGYHALMGSHFAATKRRVI